MGRVSAQNHVVHKRNALLDFEIFSDFRDFFGFKSQKIRFSPIDDEHKIYISLHFKNKRCFTEPFKKFCETFRV
jgi:hypothetical protein